MVFQFKSASCVAVGAFNIYIIQPNWLAAKGILPHDLELFIETKMDEPGFRFFSNSLPVRWLVTPTRIVIETEDANENCGEIMAQLLGFLPETPIVAVGINTSYSASGEPSGIPDIPNYPIGEVLPDFQIKQRAFQAGVQHQDCLYNVQLTLTNGETLLLTNTHIASPTMVLAQNHTRRFMEHRKTAVELAKHHLKVNFDV